SVVKRITVADGDHVAAGDELIELDTPTNAADRDRLARDVMQAELDIARLRAALAGEPELFEPPADADLVLAAAERQQLVTQLRQQRAKLEGLDHQITAKTAERDHAKATTAKIDASLPLLQQTANIYERLRENQFTSQIARLEAERLLS